MHHKQIEDLLSNSKDRAFPPDAVAESWERVREHRRYYRNHGPEIFAHRPELHIYGDAPATADFQAAFTPAGLGREIAALSAGLLFSEDPEITGEGDVEQTALDLIASQNTLPSKLHAAAHTVASEGTVGLRILRDDAVNGGRPILTVEPADSVLSSERYGRTDGGVVIATIERDKTLWRLLEEHGKGYVRRRLYKGTSTRLGTPAAISEGPVEWRDLRPEVRTGLTRPTLIRWDNLPGGDSDLRGIEAMLDALDDAVTLGRKKARASAPLTFVNRTLADENNTVRLDGAIFLNDALSPVEKPERMAEVHQGSMQASDHATYLSGLREQAISAAGYSLASWGLGEGGRADSGRALRLRQSRTLLTLAAKSRQAKGAISEALSVALEMVTGAVSEVGVELGDGMPADPHGTAEEIAVKRSAGVVSVEQAVRELHPSWSDEEIQAEAVKAKRENSGGSDLSPDEFEQASRELAEFDN